MDEFNNLKYNLTNRVTSASSLGTAYIRDEAQIRYTIEHAGVTNLVRVEARLTGQSTWTNILEVTGTDSQVADVATWEEIQVTVVTYDPLVDHIHVYASSFDNVSSSGSGFSGDYNDLTNTPTFATVATSGDYGDLINTPTFPTYLTATAVIDWASIGGDLHLNFAVSVPGALPNDFVVLGLPVGIDGGTVTEAFVSAADVVTIRSHNVIAVAVDQPARTYRVLVIQYP